VTVWLARQAVSFREVLMRIRTGAVVVVVLSILWTSPAMAQQRHVVDAAALSQAIAAQAAMDQLNRHAVLDVLQGADARALAAGLGLSVTRAEAAMSTLSSADLAALAESARQVDGQLAGGADPIVISVTTLLLIIIIVILIAN
jgi:hypothetical protein